jgi:hypothetical protein
MGAYPAGYSKFIQQQHYEQQQQKLLQQRLQQAQQNEQCETDDSDDVSSASPAPSRSPRSERLKQQQRLQEQQQLQLQAEQQQQQLSMLQKNQLSPKRMPAYPTGYSKYLQEQHYLQELERLKRAQQWQQQKLKEKEDKKKREQEEQDQQLQQQLQRMHAQQQQQQHDSPLQQDRNHLQQQQRHFESYDPYCVESMEKDSAIRHNSFASSQPTESISCSTATITDRSFSALGTNNTKRSSMCTAPSWKPACNTISSSVSLDASLCNTCNKENFDTFVKSSSEPRGFCLSGGHQETSGNNCSGDLFHNDSKVYKDDACNYGCHDVEICEHKFPSAGRDASFAPCYSDSSRRKSGGAASDYTDTVTSTAVTSIVASTATAAAANNALTIHHLSSSGGDVTQTQDYKYSVEFRPPACHDDDTLSLSSGSTGDDVDYNPTDVHLSKNESLV